MKSLFVLISIAATACADLVFPAKYVPREAKVVVQEPPAGVTQAWRTQHYLFLSDKEIGAERMQRFATTMEAVPRLLESLPFPFTKPPGEDPLEVRLCADAEGFEHLGGPVGAAGYYDGRKPHILLRADFFLTPPQARPSLLAPRPNEDILVHELCHAHMDRIVALGRPWVFEGLAEYFSAAHEGGGRFDFKNSISRIRAHVRKNQPLAADGTIPLPRLSHLTSLTSRSWLDERQLSAPQDAYRPYVASLLLVHYHLEGGPERRELLQTYLTALQEYRSRRQPRPDITIPQPAEVEERLQKFWSERGLQLRFTSE